MRLRATGTDPERQWPTCPLGPLLFLRDRPLDVIVKDVQRPQLTQEFPWGTAEILRGLSLTGVLLARYMRNV